MTITNLYLISEGADGPVKIGISQRSPLDRLKELQTGNGRRLRLVGQWRFPDYGTAYEIEQFLHECLSEEGPRLVGEWFQINEATAESAVALGSVANWEYHQGRSLGFVCS